MINSNKEVQKILEAAGTGAKVAYYHPECFNDMPVVSYYEISALTGMCYDNEEQAQKTAAAVDIWGKSGAQCSGIAVKIDRAMQQEGWYREFSGDLPPEDGIHHKHMRFYKEIFYED